MPNRQFVMEKNKNFNIPGIPKGNLDTITTKIVKSAERQTQDVISGKLDYMQDPPPADLLPAGARRSTATATRSQPRSTPTTSS